MAYGGILQTDYCLKEPDELYIQFKKLKEAHRLQVSLLKIFVLSYYFIFYLTILYN